MRARLNLNPTRWGVRAIAEIGVAVALAAALSWIAQAFPLRMPQGGSFGLEMLPILFVAVRRGVVPGVVAGGLFGLLQLAGVAGAPYIYHPSRPRSTIRWRSPVSVSPDSSRSASFAGREGWLGSPPPWRWAPARASSATSSPA